MSSPYGWGVTPSQPSNNGVPESTPSQTGGCSQQSTSPQNPSYGFNNQPQPQPQGIQSTPQYGFGAQSQQSAPQQGFDAQSQQSAPQQGASYGFNNGQEGQQPVNPYAQLPQQGASYGFNNGQEGQQPVNPYAQLPQQGINNQPLYQGNYPSMQGQFDNNKYNTKAILGFIFSFVCWPAGLVLSILGRNEIKRNGGKGKGLTTASFVLCGISVVAAIVAIVMVFTSVPDYSKAYSTSYDKEYSYSQDSAYYGSAGTDNVHAISQNENGKIILDQVYERNN